MDGDRQVGLRPRASHVEQSQSLGLLDLPFVDVLIGVPRGRDPGRQLHLDASVKRPQDGGASVPARGRQARDDDEGELEALRGVDRGDPHRFGIVLG